MAYEIPNFTPKSSKVSSALQDWQALMTSRSSHLTAAERKQDTAVLVKLMKAREMHPSNAR